jgi:hypothetical protein
MAALLSAAFESKHIKALLALPRSGQVLVCAARGLCEKEAAKRAHQAAFEQARAEERSSGGIGGAACGTFEGAALSFAHAATTAGAYKAKGGAADAHRAAKVEGYKDTSGSGVAVAISAVRDAFSRLCRRQLLQVVDSRDFADLLDRLEAAGLLSFQGRVGVTGGGGGSSSSAKGRMKSGGDRVTQADAWAQK